MRQPLPPAGHVVLFQIGERFFVSYGKVAMEVEQWWFEHLKADDRAIVTTA